MRLHSTHTPVTDIFEEKRNQYRRRKILFPHELGVRPTGDRIRETLFNWLQPNIVDANCLDLFAGSGSLGLEAKSRGCASCILIENNKKTITCLQNTIESFGASVDLINDDALDYLVSTQFNKKFDIVFVDPPFNSNLHESAIQVLEEKHLLNVDAKIYVENDVDASELLVPKNWSKIRNQVAGQVRFMLYSRSANLELDK